MKIHFSIILMLSLLCLCCTSDNKTIQKTWIGKYVVYDIGTENESIQPIRTILKFEQEHYTERDFYVEFITDYNEAITKSYKFKENQISIRNDSLFFQNISSDSLVLFSSSDSLVKVVFEPLPKYNQAHREKELFDFLTSNSFLTQEDTVRVEFTNTGTYITNGFNPMFSGAPSWRLEKFESELFLTFIGHWGPVLHVEDFDSERIVTKMYWKENKEFIYNKTTKEPGFERFDILGEWQQERHPSGPPIPSPFPDNKEFYTEEFLKISDSEIIKFLGFGRDTFNWEMNRERDIIMLDRETWYNRQWNILAIKNDTLLLKRQKRIGGKIETAKFTRKK